MASPTRWLKGGIIHSAIDSDQSLQTRDISSVLRAWEIAVHKLLMSGALITTLMALAAPACAGYGAFAYDDANRQFGYSVDQKSDADAATAALKDCGTDKCKIVFRTEPKQCGAIAVAENKKAWGGARRDRIDKAKVAAIANCQKRTSVPCKVRASGCNQ
jgi:hypothetical protein